MKNTSRQVSNLATNWVGRGNTVTSTGGYFNGARNVVGSGNVLSVGSRNSNLNLALNLFGNANHLNNSDNSGPEAGGPGNLNVVLNGGGSGNTVSAGATGTLNWAANVFGAYNTVAAGPGPLAAAWTVFADGLNVTKKDFGIAINDFRIGGARAATSGENSKVPTANAVP